MRKLIFLLPLMLLGAVWLSAVEVTIGSDATYNSYTSYPAAYGGYYKNAREQYLVTGLELAMAGGGAGNITSLAFNVYAVNACNPLPNFSIRLGHTSLAALTTTFATDLTQVYTVASYQPIAGWNTHVFSTPFAYNGTDNLVVEVTFTMQGAYTENTSTYYTPTNPIYKALYYRSDSTPWNTVTTGAQSYNRPNLKFDMAAVGPIPPFPANLVSPTNGYTYLPTTTTLNWAGGGGIPQFYKVHFGTVDPPPLVTVVDSSVTSYAPALAEGITYYWRIVPFNAQGDAVGCPVWNFTTAPPGTVVIGNGTDYSPKLPINAYYGYSYSQVIYLVSELGGPGLITSLAWYWNGASASTYSNDWTIYLGHSLKNSFTSYTDWEPLNGLTQVFTGTVNLPATPGWITVPLATPFGYDGYHNLVVAVDENEPNYDSSSCGFYCTATPDPRGLLYYEDYTNPDPAAPPQAMYARNAIANLALVKDGVPNIAPLAPILMAPANGATGLPLEGFDLHWTPNLAGGGLPDGYGVYISTNPDPVVNPTLYATTSDMQFNPVTDGGLAFLYLQQWYWTVKAIKNGFPDSPPATTGMFEIIGSPPEITVNPGQFNQTQDHGLVLTQDLSITNNGDLPLTFALSFTDTSGGNPGVWCSADPLQGSVPGGEAAPVAVTFDSTQLEPGVYTGYYTVTHNAPDSPVLQILVHLNVTGSWPAQFSLQPDGHDFGNVEQLNPSTAQFIITNPGGSVPTPLAIPLGGVFLAYQAEANFSLQAPGLPVALSHNQTFGFTVTFTPQTLGLKNATLIVMDNLGRNIYTASLSGTGSAEGIGNIVNLQANIQNNVDVALTWILSSGNPGSPGWLHYDNGTNYSGIGDGAASTYDVAMKLPSASLATYTGMQITHIKYFPRSASTAYALKIWTGDDTSLAPSTLVYSQPATPTADVWNDVTLTAPYWITGAEAVWVGYEAIVPSGADNPYPLGCDTGPAVAGYGDLFYYMGNWTSIYINYGVNANWNIQAYVDAPVVMANPAPLLSIHVVNAPLDWERMHGHQVAMSGNVTPPERVVRGFNVFRDGVQLNTELIPTPYYLDQNLANGTYVYTVQAVYYSAFSPLSAPVTVALEYYPPYDLPFLEDWESGSLATHHWQYWVSNWQLYDGNGNPGYGLLFVYSPTQQNYGESLTSHTLNGVGYSSVSLGFDMLLSNYDTGAENWLAAEVWDGSGWNTVASWSSFSNGGNLPWTTYGYDITPYAAGHEFQIRFRAYGVDSWYLNYWALDNISLTGVPLAPPPPQPTVTYDPILGLILVDWEPVPGAEWYGVYTSPDPYGVYTAYGYVPASSTEIYIPPVDRQFYKVTAGVGDLPDGRRLKNKTGN